MYSLEHVAKVIISVLAHKYFHFVYSIFAFVFDLSQKLYRFLSFIIHYSLRASICRQRQYNCTLPLHGPQDVILHQNNTSSSDI